jgi:hypothetical protein
MDLRLYLRVIGRFWALVALGVALAVALAFVSFLRLDFHKSPHVTYRQSETWKGTEVLMLTQRGFPWGRSVYPYVFDRKTGQLIPSTRFADPSRFTSLAVFYAELANSDAVRALVTHGRPLAGTYTAKPVVNRAGGDVGATPITQIVPLIEVDGYARTPGASLSLARRVSDGLRTYLRSSQAAAAIPPEQRIDVQVLSTARTATLARGRRLTIPIIAFLGVLIVTIGLAFVLENLWPRAERQPAPETADQETSGRGPSEPTPEPTPAPSLALAAHDPPAPETVAANGGGLPGAHRTAALGRRLREARVGRGLDLRDVQAHIDVPTRSLRALESERFDLLPGEEEGRHALRSYAELLELDPEPVIGEFDAKLAANGTPSHVRSGGNGRRWRRTRAVSLPISLLAVTLAVGLLSMFWRGWLFNQAAAGNVVTSVRPVAPPRPTAPPEPVAAASRSAVAITVAPVPRRKLARLVVSASRGSSWLVVRNRWNHGKVLFAGVLAQGRTVDFRRLRLWVRLGAASNLDVTVNGARPAAGLYGTVDSLVTASGLRKVPLTL